MPCSDTEGLVALLNVRGAEGGMCCWCGITFFIRKPPTSEINFCPAVYTSTNTNVPSWDFWKPKQRVAHLLLCEQRSGHWYGWVPLSLEQPLPLQTFQFIPLSPPQSQHMLNSQLSSVPWLWEGHPKMCDPGQQGWVSAWHHHLSWPVQINQGSQCLKWK